MTEEIKDQDFNKQQQEKIKQVKETEKLMGDFHESIKKSLASTKCTYCTGIGHWAGQCGTLKVVDKIIMANKNLKDEWVRKKKSKINVNYKEQKRSNMGYVITKKFKEIQTLWFQMEELKVKTGKKTHKTTDDLAENPLESPF